MIRSKPIQQADGVNVKRPSAIKTIYNYLQSPMHVQFSCLSKTPLKKYQYSILESQNTRLNSQFSSLQFSSVSSLHSKTSKFYFHQFYSPQQLSSIKVSWFKKVLIMLIMRNYSTTNKLRLCNYIRNPIIHNMSYTRKIWRKLLLMEKNLVTKI